MDGSQCSELCSAKPCVEVAALQPTGDDRIAPNPSVEHFVLSLAALGFAGALLVSAADGVNEVNAPTFRLVLAVVLVEAGALLGLALSARPVLLRWRWLIGLVVLVVGVAVGGVVGTCFGNGPVRSALAGLLDAAIFLPSVFLVTHAARAVGRAPTASLVDGAERRAVWAATALSVAVGYCTVGLLPMFTVRRAPQDVGYVCLAMALVASLALVTVAALDLVALRRARRVDRINDPMIDRAPTRVVRGASASATTSMKRAVARSLGMSILASVATAAPLVVPRMTRRAVFVRVARETFVAPAAPLMAAATSSAPLPGASVVVPTQPPTHPPKKSAAKKKKKASHSKNKPGAKK